MLETVQSFQGEKGLELTAVEWSDGNRHINSFAYTSSMWLLSTNNIHILNKEDKS